MSGRGGRAGGLSLVEAVLTLLVLVFLTLGFLRLFSQKTTVPFAGSGGGTSLSIESALSTLARDVRNASAGPLPLSVLPVANDVPEGYTLPRSGPGKVRVRKGTDVLSVRGILRHPVLVLDAAGAFSGEAPSTPSGGRNPGRASLDPGKFQLRIARFPLRLNPALTWIVRPGGAGRKWNEDEAVSNGAFDSTIAALGKRTDARDVYFVVAAENGTAFAAKVTAHDSSLIDRGCDCKSPVPYPGDCPPGRRGCYLEVTLDFTAEEARDLDGQRSEGEFRKLGSLVSGGVLDDVTYFIASGEGSEGSYLASATRAGEGYEVSRVADEIEDLQVAYGLAEDETGFFDPLVSEVSSPRPGVLEKGGDQWWPNRPGEPMPAAEQLRTAFGESRLRMLRLSVRARGGDSRPAEIVVPVERGGRW